MKVPVWVLPEVVALLHRDSLARFGGLAGTRDAGLLASALAPPQQLSAYGQPTVFELAARYTFGFIKNHPYIDGNKRTGFVAAILFLELNG